MRTKHKKATLVLGRVLKRRPGQFTNLEWEHIKILVGDTELTTDGMTDSGQLIFQMFCH